MAKWSDLAVVIIDQDTTDVRYCLTPFEREPDFKATSINYDLVKLLAQARSRHEQARKKGTQQSPDRQMIAIAPAQGDFDEVVRLIDAARTRAVAAVNTTLIELYWSIGEYITRKTAEDGWGKGTVEALADHIQKRQPNARGFSASNLWRMMQFVETYRGQPKLATLSRELSWSHNLAIMSRSKRDEEREFYLRMATQERWSFRELQRQLNGSLFERVVLSPTKLSAPLRELHPEAATAFKDSYLVEFLDLPRDHSERDLQQGLVENLKQFLIELGRDFCFAGSQYPLQVGGRDFVLDLLFFNRGSTAWCSSSSKLTSSSPSPQEITAPYHKKLIEVGLPLIAINAESAEEVHPA